MSDQDNLARDHRPAILQELDDYNTADMSDGIMLGILNEQQGQEKDFKQWQQEREGSPKEEGEPRAKQEPQEKPPEDYYAPLNSSIQDLRRSQEQTITDLRNEISQLRGDQQERARAASRPHVDPETPLTYGHVEPLARAMEDWQKAAYQSSMRSEYQRAQLEYLHFKTANPDFSVSPQELDEAFRRYCGNDLNLAQKTPWTAHFGTMYQNQTGPAMAKERDALRQERDALKQKLERYEKSPRNESQAQPLSSSLRPGGRAIQSPIDQTVDDVVQLGSFKKGKSFKSFGQELLRKGYVK